MNISTRFTPFFLLAMPACSDVEKDDHDGHHHHDHEAISTVVLNFTSQADNDDTQEVRWVDGEGQDEDISLTVATAYDLTVTFWNELESDPENITIEIEQEADEHQVFFTGSALDDGLVTHTYEDSDDEGLPLGLENTIEALAAGPGDLTVTLRHLPFEDGNKVKREGMAEAVADAGDLSGISGEGENDVSIDFKVVVQ